MRHNKETQIINHLLETFSPKEFSNFNVYKEFGKFKLTFETTGNFENSNNRVENLINFINENWYNIGNKNFEIIPILINKDFINESYDKVDDGELKNKISIVNRKIDKYLKSKYHWWGNSRITSFDNVIHNNKLTLIIEIDLDLNKKWVNGRILKIYGGENNPEEFYNGLVLTDLFTNKEYKKIEEDIENLFTAVFGKKLNYTEFIINCNIENQTIQEQLTNDYKDLESSLRKYKNVQVDPKSISPNKNFQLDKFKNTLTPVDEFIKELQNTGFKFRTYYIKDMESGFGFNVFPISYTNGKMSVSFEPLSPNKNVMVTFKSNF